MKKIIILLSLLFIPVGCYDYNELNDLAIITGIGLDYAENKYSVTLEIQNEQNSGESNMPSSYLITGDGKTLSEAIQIASLKITKVPYLKHIKVMVLGDNMSREKIAEIIDYLFHDMTFCNDFYPIVAKENSALNILENAIRNETNTNEIIEKMLENSHKNYHISKMQTWEDILKKFLEFGIDPIVPSIIEKDGNLELDGLALFDELTLQGYLSLENSINYNMIANNADNIFFNEECDSGHLTVKATDTKSMITTKSNKISINVSIDGTIIENGCYSNLSEAKNISQIKKSLEEKFKEQINSFVQIIKEYNSDILGFGSLYYKTYRFKEMDWKEIGYEISVNFHITDNISDSEVKYDN